jgi:hypothetical protein
MKTWSCYEYKGNTAVKQQSINPIKSDGRWGRKSLPTKKHINTQSSKLLWKKPQNIQNYVKYEIKYYLTYVYS